MAVVFILFKKNPNNKLCLYFIYQLSIFKQLDYQKLVSLSVNQKIFQLIELSQTILLTRFDQCLSSDEKKRKQEIKDGFIYQIWLF